MSIDGLLKSWLINSRTIAKKVKNASQSCCNDYGANRECPNCHYQIDNSDISHEWPGLPAGVKFDPSDIELLEHLAAKCGGEDSKPHMFIEEFIPTLDVDNGICYAHPEKLPGAKKDGSCVHFFHKTINAYATGQRKRRKVQSEHDSNEGHVRWHKTGKTKAVMENGIQKGCKKIMVLYKSSKRGSKPDKSNWVMHQYHLGTDEDEKEGEYVVSKIFYQLPKQTDKVDDNPIVEDSYLLAFQTSPRTPNPNPPNPPRIEKSILCDDVKDEKIIQPFLQEHEIAEEAYQVPATCVQLEDDLEDPGWLAGESQVADISGLECIDSLLCKEIIGSSSLLPNNFEASFPGFGNISNQPAANNNAPAPCGVADLANLELGTPPDFLLSDLQFSSQDSILDWIDRL